MFIDDRDNFQNVIGYEWKADHSVAIEMNSFYVAAINSDVVLKVTKSVGQDSDGKNYQAYSIRYERKYH